MAIDSRRFAGAPISWGVCEVPGWGQQLGPSRVLAEMRRLGLGATELGPVGYLGDDGAAIRELLDAHGLRAVGGFVPLVLHDLNEREAMKRYARNYARLLSEVGATRFVTAVVADEAWSEPPAMDESLWRNLCEGLALVEQICADNGIVQVLHPHVGTLVETADEVEEVLARSNVRWCLDTGHLTIGGVDPVAFAKSNADRVGLVHLKDVKADIAARLRRGELSLLEATREGLFCSLGRGDVPVGDAVSELERAGYEGFYVLEQDLTIDPSLAAQEVRPADDVEASLAYLRSLGAS